MDLAIEGGASHTIVIARKPSGQSERYHFGPGNYKLKSQDELETYFQDIKITVNGDVGRIAIGMAGIINEVDKNVVKRILDQTWPNLSQTWIGSDAEIALSCLDENAKIRAIVVNGTGSNCFGLNSKGRVSGIGGFGHVLGDRNSAYDIGLKGLRQAFKAYEYNSPYKESKLFGEILQHLGLNEVHELVNWSLKATKPEIASICQVVIKQWNKGSTIANTIASKIMLEAIDELFSDTRQLIERLYSDFPVDDIKNGDIKIGITGSVFTKCKEFSGAFMTKLLATFGHKVTIEILKDTTPGAFKKLSPFMPISPITEESKISDISKIDGNRKNQIYQDLRGKSDVELTELIIPNSTDMAPTEVRNPKSMQLDKMPISEAIDLFLDEENSIHDNIRVEKDKIEQLIMKITEAFRNGGRLFYVGAGTSGRLGVLDASECPPTFKAPPFWVQGIISGGKAAAFESIEGAEDSIRDGMNIIEEKNVNNKDIVIGIAASGKTPYVWGSLYMAKMYGAYSVFLTFNPYLQPKFNIDMLIAINCGPEILTGSTRLKSGTATKCVLNMLTTLSMVQYGKCLENLMIDLMPTNNKLKDRAFRIVLIILEDKYPRDEVYKVLVQKDYNIKETVKHFREGM